MAFLDYPGLQRFYNRLKTWINGIVGNEDMGTTADTLKGAIAEHSEHITDLEAVKPVKAVNHTEPDNSGNVNISTVDYAFNLVADDAQSSAGEFIIRTTGGDASLSDGDAWMSTLRGRSIHTGYVPPSIDWHVEYGSREDQEPINVTFDDEEAFIAHAENEGTITLRYTTAWSENPTLYGFTVHGTPVNGDAIVIVYAKEVRGTITMASPTSFASTGWNLFDYAAGYARVIRYSDTYGFKVGGSYTKLEFSETLNGAKSDITVVDGAFTVPSDGYVWVTGGDNTSTYIYMTWSDWISSYSGEWKAYEASVIDLTSIMTHFSYGLCQVGSAADTIDFDLGVATSVIDRMEYSAANLATAKASGREYEYDENYIYIVKQTPDTYNFSTDGAYIACDHGLEIFSDTSVAIYATMLYGQNLKDKLRTDVLTISSQTLTAEQQEQVRKNLGFMRYFHVGISMYGKTFAEFMTDVKTYSTCTILYFVSSQIFNALAGDESSTSATVIVTKTSDNWFNYLASNGSAFCEGSVRLADDTVFINYSSALCGYLRGYGAYDAVSVPSGTVTVLCSFSVTPGDYIFDLSANFAKNAAGYRDIWVSLTSTGGQVNMASRAICAPVDGGVTRIHLPWQYRFSSTTTLYFLARQTSGSTLNVDPRIYVTKIK